MPPFDAERYLDYAATGDRTRYQAQHGQRWDRLKCLVLGECLEGKRRFLPAIEESVRSLCADPSWVLPAHDRSNQVFKGGNPYVDLAVAMNGYQMALAAWLLDGALPAETLALMRENVARRLTGPVLRTIDGTAPKDVVAGHWWAKPTTTGTRCAPPARWAPSWPASRRAKRGPRRWLGRKQHGRLSLRFWAGRLLQRGHRLLELWLRAFRGLGGSIAGANRRPGGFVQGAAGAPDRQRPGAIGDRRRHLSGICRLLAQRAPRPEVGRYDPVAARPAPFPAARLECWRKRRISIRRWPTWRYGGRRPHPGPPAPVRCRRVRGFRRAGCVWRDRRGRAAWRRHGKAGTMPSITITTMSAPPWWCGRDGR